MEADNRTINHTGIRFKDNKHIPINTTHISLIWFTDEVITGSINTAKSIPTTVAFTAVIADRKDGFDLNIFQYGNAALSIKNEGRKIAQSAIKPTIHPFVFPIIGAETAPR